MFKATRGYPCATIVNYGNQSDEPANFMTLVMLAKRLILKSHSLFDTALDAAALARGTKYITERLESGALKAMVDDRTFRLDEIVESHRYMESQQQTGKIVVLV